MKTKSLVLAFGLLLAAPLSALASPEGAFLIKANSIQAGADSAMVATGSASVVRGEMRVTADEITCRGGVLKFAGNVTIHLGGSTLAVTELTLDAKGDRVFALAAGKVSLGSETAVVPEGMALQFGHQLPKTQVGLTKFSR